MSLRGIFQVTIDFNNIPITSGKFTLLRISKCADVTLKGLTGTSTLEPYDIVIEYCNGIALDRNIISGNVKINRTAYYTLTNLEIMGDLTIDHCREGKLTDITIHGTFTDIQPENVLYRSIRYTSMDIRP